MTTDHTPSELPEFPRNLPNIVRRIRACESEVPAQLVLEHAMRSYAASALAARVTAAPQEWGKVLIDLVQPVENIDKNQPGYEHRMGWNQALQRVADIFSATSQPPASALPLAVGVEARLTQLLKSCRGSVKSELSRYRQMLLKPAENDYSRGSKEHEVERLFGLLESIDAIPDEPAAPPPLSPPDTGNVGAELNWRELVLWWEAGGEEWDDLKTIVTRMFNRAALPPGRGMVPLSLQKIDEIRHEIWPHGVGKKTTPFARAIERAHGITAAAATALGDGEGDKP